LGHGIGEVIVAGVTASNYVMAGGLTIKEEKRLEDIQIFLSSDREAV